MSAHRLLATLLVAPALAFAAPKGEAQVKPAPTAAPAPPATSAPATPAPAPSAAPATAPAQAAAPEKAATDKTIDSEELRREVEQRVEAAKKELREEIRAQAATQSVAQGWQEEWVEERRKLDLFTLDGYLRVRPELFHNFNLKRGVDPGGFTLFPAPLGPNESTVAGTNMRLRLEPTLNVSEEVRLRMQFDAFDNVVMGTTPEYAFSRSEWANYSIFSQTQVPPVSGLNAIQDSFKLKRAYGEVTTPLGILRFGRMGSQWALGMLYNDGNCFDCDYGDTVDRIQFVIQPLPGIFVTPMIDFNLEGPTSQRFGELGQPVDLTQSDDVHSYVLAVARRDTDQQIKSKLENNQTVLNYGAHVTYRSQRNDPVDFLNAPFTTEGGDPGTNFGYVLRNAWMVIPDLWFKFEQRQFRIEAEAAMRWGNMASLARTGAAAGDPRNLQILEFGAVVQAEYRPLEKLKIQAEIGYASGDQAPGFGNLPSRRGSDPNGFTQRGDIDGPQFNCPPTGGCTDGNIRNFMFNRDYRIDLILWRELIGTVTDALYVRPSVDYELADGLHLQGAAIYSRAIFAESTPSSINPTGGDANLGMEFNAGASYETEDGFYARAQAGILFPLGGLNNFIPSTGTTPNLESATSFRLALGVKF